MSLAKVLLVFRAGVGALLATGKRAWLRLLGVRIAAGARVCPGAVVECQGGSVSIGPGTTIHAGARLLAAGGVIVIGRNCSINPGCLIYGHGGLTIGDDVRIAGNVTIIPANHTVDTPGLLVREQGETRRGIAIGNDVWIGAGAVVLDGVSLADGSVIGAGAIVTKSTEPRGIYYGNPARFARRRGESKAPAAPRVG